MYKAKKGNVEVFLAVGFTSPIPSQEDIESEQEEKRYSSIDAGWTVVCNDRVVLYGDRSVLTGWGEAGIPRYHTQFTAIAGIVEFRSDDASQLPTTTTKRGLDASSALYLHVKDKMRDGLSLFTDFTNKWKSRELAAQAKQRIREADAMSLSQLKKHASKLSFRKTARGLGGSQYKPSLPMPVSGKGADCRIAFRRTKEDVVTVSEYLFGESVRETASKVGARCFDEILNEATK